MAARPTLLSAHPNFFFIYAATAAFHLGSGVIGLVAPASWYASPSLARVEWFASHEVWGGAYLVVGLALVVGLYRPKFTLSRLALAAGAAVVFVRAFLIALTILDGTIAAAGAVPAWLLVCALHLSQAAEPPTNPITAELR